MKTHSLVVVVGLAFALGCGEDRDESDDRGPLSIALITDTSTGTNDPTRRVEIEVGDAVGYAVAFRGRRTEPVASTIVSADTRVVAVAPIRGDGSQVLLWGVDVGSTTVTVSPRGERPFTIDVRVGPQSPVR